jgi:hypothetical protein
VDGALIGAQLGEGLLTTRQRVVSRPGDEKQRLGHDAHGGEPERIAAPGVVALMGEDRAERSPRMSMESAISYAPS